MKSFDIISDNKMNENQKTKSSLFKNSTVHTSLNSNDSINISDSELFDLDDLDISTPQKNDEDFFDDYIDYKNLKKASSKLKSVLDISKLMNTIYDPNELLKLVLDKIVELSSAEKGSILLLDEHNELNFSVFKNYTSSEKEAAKKEVSKTVLFDAIQQKKAILLRDAQSEVVYESSESIIRLNIHSVICVPLLYQGTPLGAIYLDNHNVNQFNEDDLEILEAFASQAAVSIKNAGLIEQINRHNAELEQLVIEKSQQLLEAQQNIMKQEKIAGLAHIASGVAHNFNNIMAGIMGNAELLDMYEIGHKKEINQIIHLSMDVSKLTSTLLEFSRGSGGEKSEIDIIEALESILLLKNPDFTSKNIKVIKHYTIEQHLLTTGNRFEIMHALINVLANAIESFDNRNDTIHNIELSAESKKDKVELHIKDNGCGIAASNLSSVFNPFFTTKGSISGGSHHGAGLGLSTAQKLLNENQSAISINSEEGVYTDVCVIFNLLKN